MDRVGEGFESGELDMSESQGRPVLSAYNDSITEKTSAVGRQRLYVLQQVF